MSQQVELYKVMVDTITANEQRRQQVTTVNISLLAAGMAALGGIDGLDPIYVALPALPMSMIWFASVWYFRNLAKAKWSIVTELERSFEMQPFTNEWKQFNSVRYGLPIGLSQIELLVPATIFFVSLSYVGWRGISLTGLVCG